MAREEAGKLVVVVAVAVGTQEEAIIAEVIEEEGGVEVAEVNECIYPLELGRIGSFVGVVLGIGHDFAWLLLKFVMLRVMQDFMIPGYDEWWLLRP